MMTYHSEPQVVADFAKLASHAILLAQYETAGANGRSEKR